MSSEKRLDETRVITREVPVSNSHEPQITGEHVVRAPGTYNERQRMDERTNITTIASIVFIGLILSCALILASGFEILERLGYLSEGASSSRQNWYQFIISTVLGGAIGYLFATGSKPHT